MFDEVIRVFVMLSRIDEISYIVQNGRVLQPGALLLSGDALWFDRTDQRQIGNVQ